VVLTASGIDKTSLSQRRVPRVVDPKTCGARTAVALSLPESPWRVDDATAAGTVQRMPEHRHAVLLVEDHDDSRDAFQELISIAGLDVVGVHSGHDALAHLRQNPGRWCLIVLDWWIRDMTGAEFRRQQLAEPAIRGICTAVVSGDARVRQDAERLGVDYFILKPIEPDVVFQLLSHHCSSSVSPATGTESS
jgi:CheY-like chemotaxis protein